MFTIENNALYFTGECGKTFVGDVSGIPELKGRDKPPVDAEILGSLNSTIGTARGLLESALKKLESNK